MPHSWPAATALSIYYPNIYQYVLINKHDSNTQRCFSYQAQTCLLLRLIHSFSQMCFPELRSLHSNFTSTRVSNQGHSTLTLNHLSPIEVRTIPGSGCEATLCSTQIGEAAQAPCILDTVEQGCRVEEEPSAWASRWQATPVLLPVNTYQ